MSKRAATPPPSGSAPLSCVWRTGVYGCRMPVASERRCGWHRYWVRMADAGNIARAQYDEFCEWWEQFQPYGSYADNHGPWWAAVEALWPALTGVGDPPVMTSSIENELLLRRAEVRRFLAGQQGVVAPWPRVHGLPLPSWETDVWQRQALASLQGGRSVAAV